jgi:hypothetical protein
MVTDRRLQLRFRIDTTDPISPTEFVDVFRCADSLTRAIAETEALALLEHLGLPTSDRLAALQRLHGVGGRLAIPAEVERVERGSWLVVVGFVGPIVLYVLKNYLAPVVQEAWEESAVRDRLKQFLRDKVFLGARAAVEQKAIQTPAWGNLRIQSVDVVTPEDQADEALEVRFERRTVIEVRSSDSQLMNEFLKRLRP